MAYFKIKPFGFDEERRKTGTVCASIWNSAGKTIESDVEWTDFFAPSWEQEEKPEQKSKFGVDTLVSIFESVAVKEGEQSNGG